MHETDQQTPSWKRITGFACHQGFIYSLFYMGANRSLEIAGTTLERADLLLTLAFMCIAFLILRKHTQRLFAPPIASTSIIIFAALLITGSLVPSLTLSIQAFSIIAEGLLVGLPLAALFIAWGLVLGSGSPRTIACEVFAATGFAAAISFACAFLPSVAAAIIPKVCAVVDALMLIMCLRKHGGETTPQALGTSGASLAMSAANPSSPSPPSYSFKPFFTDASYSTDMCRMTAGVATFGIAAGFMEAYRSDPGMLAAPDFPSTLLILALFCIAVLQSLFVEKPTEGESLGSMYRIAMLLIMAGFLFAPLLENSGVPGEAIILAGYLGLVSAFMAFFLVMGRIVRMNVVASFIGGLSAIYLGEAIGIAAGNVYDIAVPNENYSYVIMAIAGVAILFSYLFLFTEQDFRAFSAVVDTSDAMDKACKIIAQRYGLSTRESEVMSLALRGRSNERIAQELFVAKSTADTHMRRIYSKCGVSDRQELIDLGQRMAEEIRSLRHYQ